MKTKKLNIENQGKHIEIRFVDYLSVFLLIFVSDSAMIFCTNSDKRYIYFKYFFTVAMIGVYAFSDFMARKKHEGKLVLYTGIMVIVSLFNMFAINDRLLGNYFRICLFVYALFLVHRVSFDIFVKCYDSIMTVIASVSLIGFIISYTNNQLLSVFPQVSNILNYKYYNAFIYVSPVYFSQIPRNHGFSSEPGVFQCLLVIALIFSLKDETQKGLYKKLLYIVTIVTTFSTTGYICVLLWLVIYFIRREETNKTKLWFMVLIALAGSYLLVFTDLFSFTLDNSSYSVFGKLSKRNSTTTLARIASVLTNLEICFKYPLFGAGIERTADLFRQLSYEQFGVEAEANTNTVLFQFATQGLLYGILWVIPFFKVCWRFADKQITAILLCVLMFLTAGGENLTYTGLIYVMMYYGIQCARAQKENTYESIAERNAYIHESSTY